MRIGMNRNTNIAAVFVIPGPLGGFRFQGLKARSSRQQIGKGKGYLCRPMLCGCG